MNLEVKGVFKKFGNNLVLKEVDLSVNKGEILGLLGRNGAGKTVLINIMIGILEPSRGEMLWNNKKIGHCLDTYKSQINMASSYQSLQMQESGWENLITFAGLYGVDKPSVRVEEVLRLVGVNSPDLKKRKLMHLSSGEMGRINLAKALLNKPKILFLDEPTAFLDPVFKSDLMKLIRKINKEWKMTIIFSSHQFEEISYLCDRVLILKEGRVSYTGEVNDRLIEYY